MVNEREKMVAEMYENSGYTPLRGGAPDWLMVKAKDGKIRGVVFVEVKSPSGQLRYNQAIYKSVLERLGADVRIEVVD